MLNSSFNPEALLGHVGLSVRVLHNEGCVSRVQSCHSQLVDVALGTDGLRAPKLLQLCDPARHHGQVSDVVVGKIFEGEPGLCFGRHSRQPDLVVHLTAVVHVGPGNSGNFGLGSGQENGSHHLMSLSHHLWNDPTSQFAVIIPGGDVDVEVGLVQVLDVLGRQPERSVGPSLCEGGCQILHDLE